MIPIVFGIAAAIIIVVVFGRLCGLPLPKDYGPPIPDSSPEPREVRCPKCRAYWRGSGRTMPVPPNRRQYVRDAEGRECLRVTCWMCGYQTDEPCADASG